MMRLRRGEPAELSYHEPTPAEYTDPAARLSYLDRRGLDAAWLFLNYGLLGERTLQAGLVATKLNWRRGGVEAWRRGTVGPSRWPRTAEAGSCPWPT